MFNAPNPSPVRCEIVEAVFEAMARMVRSPMRTKHGIDTLDVDHLLRLGDALDCVEAGTPEGPMGPSRLTLALTAYAEITGR